MILKRRLKKDYQGRTLLEIILVIVIMCLLSLGGMFFYNYSFQKHNSDLIYEDIIIHSEHLRNKGKARNKSVYDSSLGNHTRTGLPISSNTVNENSKIFTVTVSDINADICSDFSKKDWPLDRVARLRLEGRDYLPSDLNCDSVTENEFDLTVIFWSNIANSQDKTNPFIVPTLCDRDADCLSCQRCSNRVCVKNGCNSNEECVKTAANPNGECKVLCTNIQYWTGFQCEDCPPNAICDGGKDYTCQEGYYKEGTDCLPCPIENVLRCDSGGLFCNEGYFKENGTCVPCPTPTLTYCNLNSEPANNTDIKGCPRYVYESCDLGQTCVNNNCVCGVNTLSSGEDCSLCQTSCRSGLICDTDYICVEDEPTPEPDNICSPACPADQECISGNCVCISLGTLNSSCSNNCPCNSGLECQSGTCIEPEVNECENLPENEGDSCTAECGCANGLYCVYGTCAYTNCCDGDSECESQSLTCEYDGYSCSCVCPEILTCDNEGTFGNGDCMNAGTDFEMQTVWYNGEFGRYQTCCLKQRPILGEYCSPECEKGCGDGTVCGGGNVSETCCPSELPKQIGADCHSACGCGEGFVCKNIDSNSMGSCQIAPNTCPTTLPSLNASCYEVCGCADGYTCTDINSAGMGVCKNSKEVCCEKCTTGQRCSSSDNYKTCSCIACGTLPVTENASCYEDCGCGDGYTCTDVNSAGMGVCKNSKEVCCEKCITGQRCSSSDNYKTCSCANCGTLPSTANETCYTDCGCSGDMECYDDNSDGVGICRQSCPTTLPDNIGDSCSIACGCGTQGGESDLDDNFFCDWYSDDNTKGLCSTICEERCYNVCNNNLGKPCQCQLDGNCPATQSSSCSSCVCPNSLPSTAGSECYIGCGCASGLTCTPDKIPNTIYEILNRKETSYKGRCQVSVASEDVECSGECCQAMVNAGLSRCSDTKTSNCFTVMGNTVYYKGTSDMSFSKTTTVPSCNLNITDARLYINSNVELTVNDINLTNKVSTSSKGIYLNSTTSSLQANNIEVNTTDKAIDTYGNITAENIYVSSDNASALYIESNGHVTATGNIEAYCKRDNSSYWAIYAIGSMEADGYIHGESFGSGIHAAEGIRAGGYIKGIGGSVGGVEGTTDGGYGLDLSDGEVNAGGDLIGISHAAGIVLNSITSLTVGGNLIGKNLWGSGRQGLEMSYSSGAPMIINGDVDIFCANGAAHNHTTSYGACFYNQANMTVGGDLTSINEREYRDNVGIRNGGYLSVGGNVTASSQDDAIDMSSANTGVAKLYAGGNITATSVDQDGIEMTNAAVIHTTNGSIRATGYIGIDIGGNCEIIAGCDPKLSSCKPSSIGCSGDVTGSIVAIGEYHGISCDNSTAVIQASGDVVGIATDDKYKNEQGIYSWGTVSAGRCISGQGYYGIYAYPGQGMGCPNNGAPFYSAPSIVANGVRHDIVLKCNNIDNVSCTGVGHAYSYSKALANGCCYYWNDDKTCMSSPQ